MCKSCHFCILDCQKWNENIKKEEKTIFLHLQKERNTVEYLFYGFSHEHEGGEWGFHWKRQNRCDNEYEKVIHINKPKMI